VSGDIEKLIWKRSLRAETLLQYFLTAEKAEVVMISRVEARASFFVVLLHGVIDSP